MPDGLADGDVDKEPLDEPLLDPPVDEPEVLPLPAPLPLDVPDGMLDPELPDPLLLPPVWAIANAGARAMAPTNNVTMNLCISFPSWFPTARAGRSSALPAISGPLTSNRGRRPKPGHLGRPTCRRVRYPHRTRGGRSQAR